MTATSGATRWSERQRGEAEQHREQQHLQDLAARERVDDGVGDDVEEEVDRGQAPSTRTCSWRPRSCRAMAGSMVEAAARLQDVDDDQTDDQRERRDDLEVDQRPDADAADLLHLAHVRDADDDRGEHDRRDQHLDELDEAVAERPHGGAPLGRHEPENHAGGDADQDLDVEALQSRPHDLPGQIAESPRPMDLRQLEILQAIAETGSFTACGRKLHVSQSAISRQILLLEEELGEPLFLRVGRQVRMTAAAESLVQLGQRVFQDVKETVGKITDRTGELRGTLRLSGGMTVCLYVFPPLLKHLRRVHPHLDMRLTVAIAGRSVEEIRAGRIDAGLLTLPVEESDLVTVPALREELLLMTTPKHPLARRRVVTPQDLAEQPFVLFEAGSATRRVIDNFFASQNIGPTVVMDTENVEIIKAMVRTGPRHQHRPVSGYRPRSPGRSALLHADRGAPLFRETGWVYARANRTPRMISELLKAFDDVRGRLRLARHA